MTRITTLMLAAAAVALAPLAPLAAQGNDRVVKEMAKHNRFLPPACSAAIGDSKANDAAKALKNALEETDPAKRAGDLAQARKKATEAVTRGTGAAGWIYLGRTYLYEGDLVGADSAFARGEKMAADCREDMGRFREAAWVPLVNAGIDFAGANKTDSALALFRQANQIYRDKPNAFAGLGTIYANMGQNDSAIVYLKRAAEVATAAELDEDRNVATYNLGLVQTRAKLYDDAVKTLEQYRAWAPGDQQGARALALAYRGAGQGDKAAAIETAAGLPPSEVPGGGANELFSQGVAAFDAGRFAEAGDLFGRVHAQQPYNHDALVNQATAYYKAKDGAKVVEAAGKLVELEPMNDIGLQLLVEGYRTTKQSDKQIEAAGRRLSMPVKLDPKGVKLSPTDVELTLTATGRDAKDARGVAVKPAPVNLTFELLGADGAVLATQNATVPVLQTGATHELKVAAQANGITGWRYKAR
ncbi:MAG TPA: tetratricopeptide repeat protein [Gemmatimonadales bacterium]|nr:tetratricopeptide repeat protein [Gemmatimonadales bacterium]